MDPANIAFLIEKTTEHISEQIATGAYSSVMPKLQTAVQQLLKENSRITYSEAETPKFWE